MPAVTVCLNDYFQTENGKKYAKSFLNRLYNKSEHNEVSIRDLYQLNKYPNNLSVFKSDISSFKQTITQNTANETFKKSFGFKKSQIFLDCKFADQPCNLTNIIWKFDSYFGNCYRLNSGYNELGQPINLFKMKKGLKGFQLRLFTGYVKNEQENIYNVYRSYGIMISIENQSTFPMLREN